MRRTGQQFEAILDRDNLRLAFARALRGKRSRADAREFASHLEARLEELAVGLRDGTVPLGRYRQFIIHDPKERIITAPCFAERVSHHAIINVCEPVLERWLIADTYACRVGKGRDRALERAQRFARGHCYFLKLDIRKYFDSIPHDELLRRLGRRLKDRRLLCLLAEIVTGYRGPLGRGLPIGSLISQHLANFYLGWFDRFVKERLRLRGYVRYMDDMVLWANERQVLCSALAAAEAFLGGELGLELKRPYQNRVSHGMDFLGVRLYHEHRVLNRRSGVRLRRRLARLEAKHAAGLLSEGELQRRATSVLAFARGGGVCSWRRRTAVVEALAVSGPRALPG